MRAVDLVVVRMSPVPREDTRQVEETERAVGESRDGDPTAGNEGDGRACLRFLFVHVAVLLRASNVKCNDHRSAGVMIDVIYNDFDERETQYIVNMAH